MSKEEQTTLFWNGELEADVQEVAVRELPDPRIAVPPALLDSIRRCGMLVPIVCMRHGSKLRYVDGRRRAAAVKALVAAGDWPETKRVAVVVVEATAQQSAAVTVMLNNLRSANVAAEYPAVQALLGKMSEAEVARELSLSVVRVRKLASLNELAEPLAEGLRKGKVSGATAFAAAKLSAAEQRALVKKLDRDGKVTGGDVAGIRRVGAGAAAEALPPELFVPEKPVKDGWVDVVRHYVAEALRACPEGEVELAASLRRAMTLAEETRRVAGEAR